MTWQEVREQFPYRWLVVEGTNAHTQDGRRIINQVEVISTFAEDWRPAWDYYEQLHAADYCREYYVLHTNRTELSFRVKARF